ncbi:MAG: hypothetical protein U1F43_30860 [Myxococcota bacterium]
MSTWPAKSLLLVCAVATAALTPRPAAAYEFLVESETIGDVYQLVTSGNDVLNRRKLHEYLGLSMWDITGHDEQRLSVRTLFRFDADFGLSDAEVADTSLRRDSMTMQFAYIEGHDLLGGYFDFKLGRHLKADAIDYLVLDGATVAIGTPLHVALELEGGKEVKADLWSLNANNQMETDGTRLIRYHGDQPADAAMNALSDETFAAAVTSWVVGAWLVTRDINYAQYKIGYRRIFSGGAVDSEKIAGAFRQRIVDGVDISGVASWDLFNGRFDRLEAKAKWRITDWTEVEAEYVRTLPSFDADSIWNIFTAFAQNDVNVHWRLYPSDQDRVSLGGMFRLYGNEAYIDGEVTAPVNTVVQAWGADAGYSHGFGKNGLCGRFTADFSLEGGYGGSRMLAGLGAAWSIVPRRWELDGRVTAVDIDDEYQSNLHAFSFGYELGARYLIDKRAAFAVTAEHNMNRLNNQQFRVFALVDLALWL